MKNTLLTFLLTTMTFGAPAQEDAVFTMQGNIIAQRIEVAYQKTTCIIFSHTVKSVDRGSDDIIAQKAPGVENVLRVKANKEYFKETNLSVITADGSFYSFTVNYNTNPSNLAVKVPPKNTEQTKKTATNPGILFSENTTNETQLRKLAAQASITAKNISHVHHNAYGVDFRLTGLYLFGNWFVYKFTLNNSSEITYDIEQLHFYIEDRRMLKRTARQQSQLHPLLIVGASKPLKGRATRMLIAVLPKQTIATDKQLTAELQELNGGRNLRCGIRSSTLLKAKTIRITPAVDNIPNVMSAVN